MTLGEVPVGSIVQVNEDGVPADFIVVGKDISGNTYILRQDVLSEKFSFTESNYYGSAIKRFLYDEYLPKISSAFRPTSYPPAALYNAAGESVDIVGGGVRIPKLAELGITRTVVEAAGALTTMRSLMPDDPESPLAYFSPASYDSAGNAKRKTSADDPYWTCDFGGVERAYNIEADGTFGVPMLPAAQDARVLGVRPIMPFKSDLVVTDMGGCIKWL